LFIGHGALISGRSATRLGAIIAAGALAAVTLPVGVLAGPPSSAGPVEVSAAVAHAVSPPLRDLGPTAPSAANLRERPLRLVGPGSSPNHPDGALQTTTGPAVATTSGLSFDGVGVCGAGAGCYAPPDTNGAVGLTQYVQWVNTAYAVFDKSTGALIRGPIAGNAIWANLGGGCATNNDGDPIVQYDKLANRWILTQFSVSTTPYLQCVAVSQTWDATGSYNLYAFSEPYFNDYPKLGVWPDGYYMTFNMFNGNSFAGARACALDRAKMLVNDPSATQQCYQLSTAYGGLLPSDLDGTTPPPAGSPDYFLNYETSSLNLWKFHVDFATPANSTFSGPVNLPVASFSPACNGSNCIPQPGTRQKLDSLADRLMYRLAYRNFGDHESLVVNHSVTAGSSVGIRWYELRDPNGTPTVYQQGTFAPDSTYRWMGSIAMDKAGDIALGYSASSASVYPSIRYTGRVPTDSLGKMEAESIVQAGSGSQLQNLSRWGDYSAMSVDPVNDCTFLYTSEYLKTSGTWNWSTRIASFKFPNCGSSATPGSLVLAKVLTGGPTGYTGPFTIHYVCGSATSGDAVVAAGASQTISGIPANTSCTVSEPTLPTVPLGYAFGTPTFSPSATVSVPAGGSVTVTTNNTLNATPMVPSQPQSLTAVPANGKGVQLAWQTPSSSGSSPISGYNVYRGPSASPTSFGLVATLGVVTSYKDASTARGSTYTYYVTAVNAAGPSPHSNTATAIAR
jgi:hypothetical protein